MSKIKFEEWSAVDGLSVDFARRGVAVLLTVLGCGVHAANGQPPASPDFVGGLWEYRQAESTASGVPHGRRVYQCFDVERTPWAVAAESACEGFTRGAWERAGLMFSRSTAFRREGGAVVADTLCTGTSRQAQRSLRITSRWSGDFSSRLVVTVAVEVDSAPAEQASAGAISVPRDPQGSLTRVGDCPRGMRPGDYCGTGLDGQPPNGPVCPEEIMARP